MTTRVVTVSSGTAHRPISIRAHTEVRPGYHITWGSPPPTPSTTLNPPERHRNGPLAADLLVGNFRTQRRSFFCVFVRPLSLSPPAWSATAALHAMVDLSIVGAIGDLHRGTPWSRHQARRIAYESLIDGREGRYRHRRRSDLERSVWQRLLQVELHMRATGQSERSFRLEALVSTALS